MMVDNLHVQTRGVGAFRPAGNGRADKGSDHGQTGLLRIRAGNEIFGDSPVMQALYRRVSEIAASGSNVIIYGESGSGRRRIARAISAENAGAGAPVALATCSDGLAAVMESIEALKGLGGRTANDQGPRATLVLDGLTDLSPGSQLEVLQSLGLSISDSPDRRGNGHATRDADVGMARIIATVDSDVKCKADGLLHAETLSLLGAQTVQVPSLRERIDDVETLAQYFLALLNSEEGTAKQFSGTSLRLLRDYAWPGNLRELRSVVQRAFLKADLELDLQSAVSSATSGLTVAVPTLKIKVGTSLADAERWMIAATLKKCGGNKTRAAALLGVSLKTLYNRLNAYRAQGLDMNSVDRELAEVEG